MDYTINYTICKHIHLVSTYQDRKGNMDVFKVEVSTEFITYDRYVLQDENHISKVKERLQKMLSKLLIQVQNCTSGHELLSAENHLSSASHILQLAENNTNSLKLANKSTCPANKNLENGSCPTFIYKFMKSIIITVHTF